MTFSRPALTGVLLAASPVFAEDSDPMALGYETFEYAVPHVDLVECPGELAAEGRFCRATMHSEELHVFAFAEDGDQPLVAYMAVPAARLQEILN
jgi:hypothetical protein